MTDRVCRIARHNLLAGLALALLTAPAGAQLPCNLQSPPCPGRLPCDWDAFRSALGGCPLSVPIAHPRGSECTAGSFDLRDTQYRQTCATTACPRQAPPPLRFWAYESYRDTNHGCGWPGPPGGEWLVNAGVDFGFGTPGQWLLYQANWMSCAVQGCPWSNRTVVELSDVCGDDCTLGGREGTVDHSSWYLVASVPFTDGGFDFDSLTGADLAGGCGPASPRPAPVPGLTIAGRSEPCTGSTKETWILTHHVDPRFGDVDVSIDEPWPRYYSEGGLSDPATPLIAGFQVLYTVASSEPTRSDPQVAGWRPARDPSNPADLEAPVIPLGTTTAVTVSVPDEGHGHNIWLAARLVYRDDSINPLAAVRVGEGPRLTSMTGRHCGPGFVEPPPIDCCLGTEASPDQTVCPGESVTLTAELSYVDPPQCCRPGDPFCTWKRDGIRLPETTCTLSQTPASAGVYEVLALCWEVPGYLITGMAPDEVTVRVAGPTAIDYGNTLRLVRQGTDIGFTWDDGLAFRDVLRWHRDAAFDRPTSNLLVELEPTVPPHHVVAGEMLTPESPRFYRVSGVGCDGEEGP